MSTLSQSCAEAARKISDSQDAPLPAAARIGLWLHLAICRHCQRYYRQVRLLRSVFQEYPEHLPEVRLGDDFQREIVRQLKEQP